MPRLCFSFGRLAPPFFCVCVCAMNQLPPDSQHVAITISQAVPTLLDYKTVRQELAKKEFRFGGGKIEKLEDVFSKLEPRDKTEKFKHAHEQFVREYPLAYQTYIKARQMRQLAISGVIFGSGVVATSGLVAALTTYFSQNQLAIILVGACCVFFSAIGGGGALAGGFYLCEKKHAPAEAQQALQDLSERVDK